MPFAVERHRDPDAVRRILEALPDWFGDAVAIDAYVGAASDPAFSSYIARDGDSTIGVALVRRHFPEAAELHLIAVDPSRRGTGTGRALVDAVTADLTADACRMLTVHTVGPSFPNEPYAATRGFYLSAGFVPLEEHDALDWDGPTLILVRPLASSPEG